MIEPESLHYYNEPSEGEPLDVRPRVELFDLHGPQIYCIVEAKTGIVYTNQTGGVACNHPEIEGFLVPTNYQVGQETDVLFGEMGLTQKSGQKELSDVWLKTVGLDHLFESLDWADSNLEKGLWLPQEAWLAVRVRENDLPEWSAFSGQRAALTYENSD